jgi:hypothetical protein
MSESNVQKNRRPIVMRLLGWLIRFLASSAFATVVILASAAVLAWSTFWIEGRYGTKIVQFYVYQSSWFAGLICLLAINVIAASIVKWPWRRHQAGFLVVHAGIIVLILGCWFSRHDGIDANVSVFEGQTTYCATENRQQLSLTINEKGSEVETVDFPIAPGPLNWADYNRLGWFPWNAVAHDRDLRLSHGRFSVEMLDYCADSREIQVPQIDLEVAQGNRTSGAGSLQKNWQSISLSVRELKDRRMPRPMILGDRRELPGGGWVTFTMAATAEQTRAFLESTPDGGLGVWGQLVFWIDGKKTIVSVDELIKKKQISLPGTEKLVDLPFFDPRGLRMQVRVISAKQKQSASATLLLNAVKSNQNQQDQKANVFGIWWLDPSKLIELQKQKPTEDKTTEKNSDATLARQIPRELLDEAAAGRIDFLQSEKQKLFYRVFDGKTVEMIDSVAKNQTQWQVKLASPGPIWLYLSRHLKADQPGVKVEPVPITKETEKKPKTAQLRVRISDGDKSATGWLSRPSAEHPNGKTVSLETKKGHAELSIAAERIELGFGIRLWRFERRFDPGTSVPSYYGSLIDLVDADDPNKIIAKDLSISMNQPLTVTDPKTGRTYRLFQSSYGGPFRPGDPTFEHQRQLGNGLSNDSLYISYLSLAYDPGRGWKYAGCYMIVAGIGIMYYMKAYFFRRRRKTEDEPE